MHSCTVLLVLLASSCSCSPSSSLAPALAPALLLLSCLPSPSTTARLNPHSSLCGGALDLQTYLFMNKVNIRIADDDDEDLDDLDLPGV